MGCLSMSFTNFSIEICNKEYVVRPRKNRKLKLEAALVLGLVHTGLNNYPFFLFLLVEYETE